MQEPEIYSSKVYNKYKPKNKPKRKLKSIIKKLPKRLKSYDTYEKREKYRDSIIEGGKY